MHEFICGVSAFRLLRTPPQVLALYPPLPDISTRIGKLAIARNTDTLGGLGAPIHVLVTQREHLRYSSSVKMHLWSQELPLNSFIENELEITLSSPLFTLLTMAPHVSVTHLAMAMYELCGSFFRLPPSTRDSNPPRHNQKHQALTRPVATSSRCARQRHLPLEAPSTHHCA